MIKEKTSSLKRLTVMIHHYCKENINAFLFFKNSKFWKKSLYYSPWFFPKNGSEITKNFYYIFLYILMYLCSVESLSQFRLQFFEL